MVGTIDTYLAFLVIAGILSTSLTFYSLRKFWIKNKLTPAGILSGILAASSIWIIAMILAFLSKTEFAIYFWEQFKYIGIALIAPSWLLLSLIWTGRGKGLSKKIISLIYIIPIINIFFIFTDQWHHLIWSNTYFVSIDSYHLFMGYHGLTWYFFTTYSYVLIFIGTLYLLIGIFSLKNIYRKQSFILLIGSILPLTASILNVANPLSPYYDFTPAFVTFASIAFIWGFSSLKFIEIIPFAKDAVFNHITDPVFVFDSNNHLVEVNPAGEHAFNLTIKDAFGADIETVFKAYPIILQGFNNNKKIPEVTIQHGKETYFYDLHITPLIEEQIITGHLFSFRDISERKKTEERFSIVYRSSPTMICLSTFNKGKYIEVNDAYLEKTGWSRDEVIGKTAFEMGFWAEPAESQRNYFIKQLKQKKSIQNENFKFQDRYGNIIHGLLSAQCITIDNKTHILSNIVDITKQKNAEQTTERQLAAFQSSMDGITIFDQENRFIYLNNAFLKMFEYKKPQELLGKDLSIIYSEEMIEKFHNEIEPTFQKTGQWRGEIAGKKNDASSINLEITITKLDEGGFICISRDITKQKMVMKELEDAHEVLFTINKDLERKVKRRTKEIEQLVKQKDDFINQLGHDLKTPLTPMMVLMPILKKKAQSKKDMELFDVIIRNTHFMKDLVNKTINLAKLNSDKIEFNIEPIKLSEEIDYVISNNQIILDDNHIDIFNDTNKELYVEADRIQLQELLNNLITNAIKYTPKGGGTIQMHSIDDEDLVTITVSDTGIGMTNEQSEKIFLEFFKADDSRHDLDSSGLGLNICKRIVEKHGGKIWAESEGKGKGSTFYFTLKKPKKLPVETIENESTQND
jgi:PAS domain S-box-containing protein